MGYDRLAMKNIIQKYTEMNVLRFYVTRESLFWDF